MIIEFVIFNYIKTNRRAFRQK